MQIYITDKSGRKYLNTNVSYAFASGERRNLERHLKKIKSGNKLYDRIDKKSSRIVEELTDAEKVDQLSDDELLKELE